jgi:hypothetical protein
VSQVGSVQKTNTLALVGFISAFVIPIAGLILGILARRELDRPGSNESGRGLARWAMVLGVIGMAGQVLFFIWWATAFAAALNHAPGMAG